MRERFTTDRVYSVPGDFATSQLAWNAIVRNFDLAGHKVLVNHADGEHGTLVARGVVLGAESTDAVTFRGNIAHPNQCHFSGVGVNAITARGGASLRIEGLMVVAVQAPHNGAGHGVVSYEGARVEIGTMAYYNCDWAHIDVAGSGEIQAVGPQYILGNSQVFALSEAGANLWLNGVQITSLAPLNFSDAFALASEGAQIDFRGSWFSLIAPVEGKKYEVTSGARLILSGLVLPGSVAGTNDDGHVVL